jgi:hypothetical protein
MQTPIYIGQIDAHRTELRALDLLSAGRPAKRRINGTALVEFFAASARTGEFLLGVTFELDAS